MEQETQENQLSQLDAAMKKKVEEAVDKAATATEKEAAPAGQKHKSTVPRVSILKVIARLDGKPPDTI